MCKKAPKRFANFWCLFLCFDPHLNTVQPPQLVKATSPQRPLFFVPADSPYIYSRLNLSTTATATTACPQLPNYPLDNGQCFQRQMKKSRIVIKFDSYGSLMTNRDIRILIEFHTYTAAVLINCLRYLQRMLRTLLTLSC